MAFTSIYKGQAIMEESKGQGEYIINNNIDTFSEAKSQAIYSVSEVSTEIKQAINYKFANIKVRGEVSGCKIATSGHAYFTLKDSFSVLNAICWKSTASKLKIEDGMEVICTGNITTYPERSVYQIIVNNIEISGQGALLAMLEQRKQRFMIEGLFKNNRKIPKLPRSIGVITSARGAVIRDIMHRIEERFPIKLLIYDVPVQGEGAAKKIAAAIDFFSNLPQDKRPSTLIVARGGGSIEDLWAFNEEEVVVATHRSSIPVISAIGHETDFTLIDFAADLRAPTPTAAAEISVPVRSEVLESLHSKSMRVKSSFANLLNEKKVLLNEFAHKLHNQAKVFTQSQAYLHESFSKLKACMDRKLLSTEMTLTHTLQKLQYSVLEQYFSVHMQRLDRYKERLDRCQASYIKDAYSRLENKRQLLSSLNYENVLKRGYSIVRDSKEEIISSSERLKEKDVVEIEFANGKKKMEVL